MSTISTFGVGYPHAGWSGTVGAKPTVYVTVNGPFDGGDFGPNTVISGTSTTTGGIQEALNAANGTAKVIINDGAYTVGTVTPPAFSDIEFNPGVTFSGTNAWDLSASGISMVRQTIQDPTEGVSDVTLATVTISCASASISNIRIEGLNITALIYTVSSGSFGMAGVSFDGCNFGTVVHNNSVGNFALPTEVYYRKCNFSNQTSSSVLYTVNGCTGQTFFTNCNFAFYQNNQVGFLLASAVASESLTTCIHTVSCQIYLNPSITGCKFLSITGNATISSWISSAIYLENNSPITLLTMGTAGAQSDSKFGITFRDIDGETDTIITLWSLNSGATFDGGSHVIFSNVNAHGAEVALGTTLTATWSQYFTVDHIIGQTSCGGNNTTGFSVISTPSFPSNSTYRSIFPYNVRAYITGIGAGISAYSITDSSGTTKSFTTVLRQGDSVLLTPSCTVGFTNTGSPTWAFYVETV